MLLVVHSKNLTSSADFFPKSIALSSVQFSRSVMSDSLRPHELQHARPSCPSPTPIVHSNSSPSSQWCHPAISFSVVPFSSCPQSLPASETFPISQLFTWGGQSTGVSASASFLPKKSQGWSPLEWTGWISLQSKGLSRVFSWFLRLLQSVSVPEPLSFMTLTLLKGTGQFCWLCLRLGLSNAFSLKLCIIGKETIEAMGPSRCLISGIE